MLHEALTRDIIGAAMAVLNELKPGLDEKLYENALVIELRARGHRTLSFIADIADGRSITYRGSLESVTPSAPRTDAPSARSAPSAAAGSRVMYVIPGCYLGNVSPKNLTLREGCDISKLTTISP